MSKPSINPETSPATIPAEKASNSQSKSRPKSSTKKSQPISTKIAELDAKVEWFYGDDFTLDDAVTHFKEAIELTKSIETDLCELKNEVEVLADFT